MPCAQSTMDPQKRKAGRKKKTNPGSKRKDNVDPKLPKSRKGREKDRMYADNRKRRKSGDESGDVEWVCSGDHGDSEGENQHQHHPCHRHHLPHHHHHHPLHYHTYF